MREIVIISGKGGTGKTSVMASFSYLGGKDLVLADCDVDAADLHMLMQPRIETTADYFGGLKARIDSDHCKNCGLCKDVCRFDSISVKEGIHGVDAMVCEGCGYCQRVCPAEAISMHPEHVGDVYISQSRVGSSMVHARLNAGADNSGKLVSQVKSEAKRIAMELDRKMVLIDGSPGIGCPVISSLTGADYVVLVTEPTQAGLHDLERIYELIKSFNIPCGCIVNKFDINIKITRRIKAFMHTKGIEFIAKIPYDEGFTEAMTEGLTILEYDQNGISTILRNSWERIKVLTQG